LVDEEHYVTINDNVYALLYLLREPQNIDIVEELLELLGKVIKIEQQITPQLCQVLAMLDRTIEHYRGDISNINDVLTALN
jgi:hypothetical protein